ncbi:MAG: FAD-linked oxidase C-terminal domain-containing protein [Solirubrobacterales bacterium]
MGVTEIAAQNGVEIATFGHAGDGNMHPTIVYDPGDAEQRRRATPSPQSSASPWSWGEPPPASTGWDC